ncbi:MAG TPA: hypothetical protein VL651_05800 [Bacteroidia bacterium]|jgi:hypothetical protein|nr:hypothetical protein [Bacteroidia bacterium]
MNIKTISALGLSLVLILSSCGGRKSPLDALAHMSDSMDAAADAAKNAPPVAIKYSQLADKANQDKNIVVEGYIALPSTSYMSSSSAQVDFYERKGMFWSENSMTLNMPVGTGKNTMREMPSSYTKDDLKITLDNGNVVGVDAHVRITGHLSTYGTIDVTKVEDAGNTPTDYSTLDVTAIDAAHPASAALQGKIVSAEGTLDIPMSTLDGNYTWLYLHIKGIEDGQIVHIRYGDKENQIEPLEDGYGEDDFKVHANDGTLVGKHKIRVYGVYDDDAIKVENIVIL